MPLVPSKAFFWIDVCLLPLWKKPHRRLLPLTSPVISIRGSNSGISLLSQQIQHPIIDMSLAPVKAFLWIDVILLPVEEKILRLGGIGEMWFWIQKAGLFGR